MTAMGRLRLLRWALALCALLVLGPAAASAMALTVSSWSAPERLGPDRNGDGLVDLPSLPADVSPASWPIDVTITDAGAPACAGRSYAWTIDGAPATATGVGGCTFRLSFPALGQHLVTVAPSGAPAAAVPVTVRVRDLLIVSLGDSVASGEGNADRTGRWNDRRCHRSARAGPVLAARQLESADPQTSVTLVDLACSGAGIDSGVLRPFEGAEPGPALVKAQIVAARELTAGRAIDAVVVSAGANDIGFGRIAEDCYLRTRCDALPFEASVADRIGRLAGSFRVLASCLGDGTGPACPAGAPLEVAPDRILLTEYHDPVHRRPGVVCDRPGPFEPPFITRDEATWAFSHVIAPLNVAVASAARSAGWRFVGGVQDDFADHGNCRIGGARWVQILSVSLVRQGSFDGALHPNRSGHQRSFCPRIATALATRLGVAGAVPPPQSCPSFDDLFPAV
jgi:lysophospholipase L1-like esterase